MEAIILLIIIVVASKVAEKRREDRMTSDERFRHEWKKL